MGINPVDRVLTKNNSFDPKWLETHFLSWSTWLDPYWPGGLGFDPKRPENSIFTLVDMVWPELTRWTRFWLKIMVLTRNGPKTHFWSWSTWFDSYWPGGLGFDKKWRFWPETARKLIFYPGRHGLTCIDLVESVFMERCGWLEKNIFLNFKLFLNFFGFL